jgi:hypothetical protein
MTPPINEAARPGETEGTTSTPPRGRCSSSGSGVQSDESVVLVLLDAGTAPDLAARRGGKRSGRNQNEITDIQAVRIGHRGGDFALDLPEPVQAVYPGVCSLLELDDGDDLLGTVDRD